MAPKDVFPMGECVIICGYHSPNIFELCPSSSHEPLQATYVVKILDCNDVSGMAWLQLGLESIQHSFMFAHK